jgi:t-SNARE complex subunit (syntaxin)
MNRLQELYSEDKTNTNIYSPNASSGNVIAIPEDESNNEFKEYARINEKINDVANEIQILNLKVSSSKPQTDSKESELDTEINDMILKIGNTVRLIKDDIGRMNNEIFRDGENNIKDDEVLKIKKNQCKHLSQKLSDTIMNYQTINENYKKNKKNDTIRRIKLIYTNADGTTISDKEAEQLALQEFNEDNILFMQAREKLTEIMENRNDILRIESSMRELNQMFNDLSALILSQGEILVVIGDNVDSAVNNVKEGREELKIAKELAESCSSKMKYICCIVLIILIILIVAVVLGVTLPKT